MIRKLLSTFVITGIVRCTNLSSQNDAKEVQNLLGRDSFRIDIENREECSLQYDTMKTHFRHVYLVQCGGNAKSVRLNFGGESKKGSLHQSGDAVHKGGAQQSEEPNQQCSTGRRNQIAFFNERGKKITSDNLTLKFENNRKVIYKACQMEDPPKCTIIYVIISFKVDVMGLRELLLSNFTTDGEEGAKLNLLHPDNVRVGNVSEYLLQHFLLDSKKVTQFYEISVNVTNDGQPLYLYASSHASNFVYLDRNLRHLLKEEKYQYETYFYKFRCAGSSQLFAATSDARKASFFVYRLGITCSGGGEDNQLSVDGRSDFNPPFHVSVADPTFMMHPFRMDEFKYDVFTPGNHFWLRINSPNGCHPPSNISLNDKRVISEYSLVTFSEHMDEQFYDNCIEEWQLLQKRSPAQQDENCSDLKKRQGFLIFGNVHDEGGFNCPKGCKRDLFGERIHLESTPWGSFFSPKRKTKFRNHQEIGKVIFPTKRIFILKYTSEPQKKHTIVGANTVSHKTKVLYYFFHIHRIPTNIVANSFAFIAFLKNANCGENNICHQQNDGQPSYIQVVFKKKKNKHLNYLSTNVLLTQKGANSSHSFDQGDNLKLLINNEHISDHIKYPISEIGNREEKINIKIVDQNDNILYNTDLVIIRKNVFYKIALQFLSYFSYAYIIFCSCLHPATVLTSIQFLQILTLLHIKYDAFPPLYNYFLKKLHPLSFIWHFFDVKVYRKSAANQLASNEQPLRGDSATVLSTTNGGHNLGGGHRKKENHLVESQKRHYYGGKLSHLRDTHGEYLHWKANKMTKNIIKGDSLHKDNHHAMGKETPTNETHLEELPLGSKSKKDAVSVAAAVKKYLKKEAVTTQRNKKWEDEIMLMHTLVSTLLNIIAILLLLAFFHFVYAKCMQRKVIAKMTPVPFLPLRNFVPLIYDLFLFPVVFITSNLVLHESGYHVRVYFLQIDICVLKFVSALLLFCYVSSYVLLSLHVILSMKSSNTYSCYLQRFIPLSISIIRGIVTKPLPFQFLFNRPTGIYLPARLTPLRSAARGKSHPSYALTNQHVKGTRQMHKEEIHPFFFSLSSRGVKEAKSYLTKNASLKRIIRNYVDRRMGRDKRIGLSHHQPLLQDIALSVPTGRDTPKKGAKKNISSKRHFPEKGKSPGGITTQSDDQKGDASDPYDYNDDGDRGDSSPARDTRNNPLQQRNIGKLFKNAFCILDRHISEHHLGAPPFDSDSSYPDSEKYKAQFSALRENEPLTMDINKYICKFLRGKNREHGVDHQIGASTQIKIHPNGEDKKGYQGTLREKFPTVCLTKCIRILHRFNALSNRCKYKMSYDEAVKQDAWRNKLLRVTINRESLNRSIHSSNGARERNPNLRLLTHQEDTHIGYLYDKVSLFKKTFFVKKAVKIKHVHFLLSQKREIQIFVNNEQVSDDALGIYSLLANNLSNENASHFLCVRLMTAICLATVNLLIRKDVRFSLLSLSLFFFALFVYNFASILRRCGEAELWEPRGGYGKGGTSEDKRGATESFTHGGKLSSGQLHLRMDRDDQKHFHTDGDNAKRGLSPFRGTRRARHNEWLTKDMLTYERRYPELVLSAILFFLLLCNMLPRKGEHSELSSLLLSLLTTSLCVNPRKVKSAFQKIIAHARYGVAAKWHSAYLKTYALYFLHAVEKLYNYFIRWVVTMHCKNKEGELPTERSTTRKTSYANLCSYLRDKLLPNCNGMTFKNLRVDKIEIHHQEKDIAYKYETLTLDGNCKSVFNSELRKNMYVIGKMDLTKCHQEGLPSNVPIYTHNDVKQKRNYYICSIEVVDEENLHSRKSLSLYIKRKDTKREKVLLLHSSRKGGLLWSSKITRKGKPPMDQIPTYGELPSEGGSADIKTNKATGSRIANRANSATPNLGRQTGERIKADKYSYTVLGKEGLTIRSLFIKPNRTYKIQPVFKEKHLKCVHVGYGKKTKPSNLSFDNFARFANSYPRDPFYRETFPKCHKNGNTPLGCGKREELSNEGDGHPSSGSRPSGVATHRKGNSTENFSRPPCIRSQNKGRKFRADEIFQQFRVTCEDIGTLIVSHDIHDVDTFEDVKVENEYGESFCLNSLRNCFTFIKKKKIIILSHPCFYKNETYYVYLRGGRKRLSDYLTEGIHVQSSPNGEIILSSFSQNDQTNTDITDGQEDNSPYRSRTLLDDHIDLYKISDYKKKKKFFFVKVNKKSNTFYAQSYVRRKCKNAFDIPFVKELFHREYHHLQEQQPIGDFLEEISHADFVPIQLLYKLKTRSDVAAAKKLQNYFIECLNESPILCKGGDKRGDAAVAVDAVDPDYPADVAYELLTTSEERATTGKKKTYGGSSIEKSVNKNKNWLSFWRKAPLFSGTRSTTNYPTNGILQKGQPKNHEGAIHTQDGHTHQNRSYKWREGLLHVCKKHLLRSKKKKKEILYRYAANYKDLIKTYITHIKIYESKYNYVKHNKGNIKVLANILLELLSFPYVLDVFQRYNIVDKREGENSHHHGNNIGFNIYDVYEKCSLNKKHTVFKIVNYLEELAAYKIVYIITFYKDKLNYLQLLDKLTVDESVCKLQRDVDRMFYHRFGFSRRGAGKAQVSRGRPDSNSPASSSHDSSSYRNRILNRIPSRSRRLNRATNGKPTRGQGNTPGDPQNRRTHEKTLHEVILEKYIKRRKSFARKFYEIKKSIREIAKKYRQEEQGTKKILFYFPFFIHKKEIIKMKKNVEQQIYEWNACLTNFFSNFLNHSLTKTHICHYNLRILNKHILNTIRHSMFGKQRNAKHHFPNVNFVHIVISLSFLNPQKALLFSPTFFYMKYLPSKPIFVLCNQDEIGSLLGGDGGRARRERGHSPKWEESSSGGSSPGGENPSEGASSLGGFNSLEEHQLRGMESQDGERKKTRREKSKRCNSPRGKKNALPGEANIGTNIETNICRERAKRKEHKILPCYLEVINDHLLIYLFDNYDNKLCWRLERGNYSLETREVTDREAEKEARDAQDATGEGNRRDRCTKIHAETVARTSHLSEEGLSNCGTSDNEQSEVVYTVISTDENDDSPISSLIKKKKKTMPKYTRLEQKNESSPVRENHLRDEKNCFVKCVRLFSNCFSNLRDSLGRNLCLFFACYEGEENKLRNGNSDYIKLIVRINPAAIPQLSNALTINDHAWGKLTERNKLLIRERVEEVCLDAEQVFPLGGPPEMDPSLAQSEEKFTHTTKDQGGYSNSPSEGIKVEEFAQPEGVFPQDGKLNGETPLSSTHVSEKELTHEEWHELHLFTFSFYRNKLSELITNCSKLTGVEASNSHNHANAYHDVQLDIIEKRNSINEAWRYEQLSESAEKEYDGRKEEQRNISYLLKGIERMRSATFVKKTFMEDSKKCTHKELIFYDKNQQLFCKYVGDMKNKFYNGHGKLYDKFNSLIYDGQWLNAQKHGKGKLLFKHFNIWYLYEGQFSNDEIVDKGIISLIDKEYVKRIQSDKINKLCPLLIKVNFGKYKSHKSIKGEMEQYPQFEKELIKQIEKTVMENYSPTNNVDFWPKEITDIYFPYLKKWNIYSFYCSCNIENIKGKKEIFESNENNFKNLIGYPSFELRNGRNDFDSKERRSDDHEQAGGEGTPGEDYPNQPCREAQQSSDYPSQPCREAQQSSDSPKQPVATPRSQEHIVYKRDKTNVLHEQFFEYMKKKNEQKLYYPLLSKTVGLAKIIYADKSEYIGPINSRGQPNTNEQFPKAIFNNEDFFYEGEMKNFLPHGYGIFKNKKDGRNTYLGFWKNGHREGNGSLHLRNKKYIVQANFTKDKLHTNVNIFIRDEKICKLYISSVSSNSQKIKIFFRNGYIFYGHFSENYQRNGIGILIDSNNKILYHGYYKNDVIDKFCYILRHKDNTIYCGNLHQGMKKGFGKLYYEEKLHFDDENEFNLSLSNAKILARKLESYDGIDINSDIPLNFALDSNHVIYVGYWDENNFSHFGSCNLRNGIYKGDIRESKKDGFGIYIYKNKKSYKNKNRYVLSYFKKDKISAMGKYYSEYDKLKVHSFQKEQIKRKKSAYDKCFTKGKIKYEVLKTDKLYINQEIDSYITVPLADTLAVIMDEAFDKSTSFVHYLYRPFLFDLNYFLKK
ncbi:MORN repeat protein, putative [Plasmodium vivax]|uniref:MORN repeat protein, putative n=1 Tax=Plasmodium vivax TaxID=5855 RepID=A0A565A2F0_PLAVI|nr:MORN repeat protein, putative [Plasmodium vivax]